MRRYDLFVHGPATEYTGEWRHVGDFKAPSRDEAIDVASRYLKETGFRRARVFTASVTSTIGRMVGEVVRVAA